MALVTEKPEELTPQNDLDDVQDPDAPLTDPAEIRLGSTVLMVMEKPPNTGDYLDISMRVRIKRKAEDQNTPDSPLTYPRYAEIVAAWPLGEQMPKPKKTKEQENAEAEAAAAENQPALYDDEDLGDEPELLGDAAEKIVDRPGFSDGDN